MRRRRRRATLLAALATLIQVAAGSSASSQMYCDRPREPSCVGTLALFRDEFTFQICRDEMELFRRRMQEYVDCLRNEQDDVIGVLNKTIDQFNACARNPLC
jgi:hypothetical protein